MSVTKKSMHIEMPDGSVWSVPVMAIAASRAEHYKHEFENDLGKSLSEDTIPFFESDDYAIEDWAANNMNWSDVASVAKIVQQPECDYQEGWCNGEKSIV